VKRYLSRQIQDVFRSTTLRVLHEKESGFSQPDLFQNEDLAEHFAHMTLQEVASQYVVKGFIIDRIRFIEGSLSPGQILNDTFIDIGDPDGIFIRAFHKDLLSANISADAVANTRKKGIETVRCDAEHLPFKDGAVDHILFFEILEHLKNPVSALAELNRVAAKSVFVSIPSMSRTNILRSGYNPDWPSFEHHVFEFDDEDFRNIVSHAGFSVAWMKTVEVMRPVTVREKAVFLLWDIVHRFRKDPEYRDNAKDLFAGCFRKFAIYRLVKE
jgi:hypothetical protein